MEREDDHNTLHMVFVSESGVNVLQVVILPLIRSSPPLETSTMPLFPIRRPHKANGKINGIPFRATGVCTSANTNQSELLEEVRVARADVVVICVSVTHPEVKKRFEDLTELIVSNLCVEVTWLLCPSVDGPSSLFGNLEVLENWLSQTSDGQARLRNGYFSLVGGLSAVSMSSLAEVLSGKASKTRDPEQQTADIFSFHRN